MPLAQAEALEKLASRYLQAWNDHDLDSICAMHSDDPVISIGGAGEVQELAGEQPMREAYAYLLKAWPDQRIVSSRVIVDGSVVVVDSVLTGTLALPWEMGGERFSPNTAPISFSLHDVLEVEGERIARKSTWIDGIAIRRQLIGSGATSATLAEERSDDR